MPKNTKRLKIIIVVFTVLSFLLLFYRVSTKKTLEPEKLLVVTAKDSMLDSSCFKAYNDFYSSDTLRIIIAFGYKDSRPHRLVTDRYEAAILIQTLLSSCRGHSYTCGFHRLNDDTEFFIRYVVDPNRKFKKIVLRILTSSVGPDDSENRLDPFQKWQTQHAKASFLSEFKASDAIFYNGHSREGGGPDFSPPKLTKSLHADYYWYKLHRKTIKEIIKKLKSLKKHPKLMGFYSCSSKQHFLDELLTVAKDSAFIITPTAMYHSDSLKGIIGTLSALIGQYCKEDFEKELKLTSRYSNFEIKNFFKD